MKGSLKNTTIYYQLSKALRNLKKVSKKNLINNDVFQKKKQALNKIS